MPKMSIITACFNSEKFIEDTIKSVINQTYQNIEYIFVDGGSTDRTLEIIEKYRNRVSKIISEPDKGVYDAFNKGIEAATGDVIYFLNSDDYLHDSKVIEEIAKLFYQHKTINAIYGNIKVIDEKIDCFYIVGQQLQLEDFYDGKMPHHQCFFIKKNFLCSLGKFDLKYKITGDFDLVLRYFKNDSNNSMYVNRNIAVFRTGGLSSDKKTILKEKQEIIEKQFNKKPIVKNDNLCAYKDWLQLLLLQDYYLSDKLIDFGIKNVAIFGSTRTSLFLVEDLRKNKIETKVFLDNNPQRQGHVMRGIEIQSPNWLEGNHGSIDAVILSFEGDYEEEVRQQIKKIIKNEKKMIFSWKELLTFY
jgi:glycosyltransferase involved in cell wall biosynthesis